MVGNFACVGASLRSVVAAAARGHRVEACDGRVLATANGQGLLVVVMVLVVVMLQLLVLVGGHMLRWWADGYNS
jgi:hypothetical protein